MDHQNTLALFDSQIRRRSADPGQLAGRVRRTADEGDGWSGVLWSGLTADTADAEIAEQVRYFTGLGRAFEWKLYDYDSPADLGDRLLAAGFVPEPVETLMIAEVSELPVSAGLPEGVRLERVTDAAGVDLVAQAHEAAFGTDSAWLRSGLLRQLAESPGSVVVTVAMAGDLPVSSARIEFTPGTDFAGLWGGGTHPDWRGRGIYRALVAHRVRIAAERGVRYLQVDASDDSRPILRRLGFAQLCTTTPYVHRPPVVG